MTSHISRFLAGCALLVCALLLSLGEARAQSPDWSAVLMAPAYPSPFISEWERNPQNLVLAVSVAYIPFFARITRGQVLALAETSFVEASRAAGATHVRIMAQHIFPNIVPLLIIQATTNLAFAILAEASLSYLGLGTQPPEPSLGRMLTESRSWLNQAPWLAIFPGLALMALVIGTNLLGDGLRDALDPRLRGALPVAKQRKWFGKWGRSRRAATT